MSEHGRGWCKVDAAELYVPYSGNDENLDRTRPRVTPPTTVAFDAKSAM